MRRLLRILLSLSLLVSLASALLWPLSYFWNSSCYRAGGASIGGAEIEFGRITFKLHHDPVTVESIVKVPGTAFWQFWSHRYPYSDFNENWRESLRFSCRADVFTRKSGTTFKLRELAIPLWCPMCVCALAPALASRRRRARRQRIRDGLCLRCGYDLRASADRCPECSTVPEQLTKAAA